MNILRLSPFPGMQRLMKLGANFKKIDKQNVPNAFLVKQNNEWPFLTLEFEVSLNIKDWRMKSSVRWNLTLDQIQSCVCKDSENINKTYQKSVNFLFIRVLINVQKKKKSFFPISITNADCAILTHFGPSSGSDLFSTYLNVH